MKQKTFLMPVALCATKHFLARSEPFFQKNAEAHPEPMALLPLSSSLSQHFSRLSGLPPCSQQARSRRAISANSAELTKCATAIKPLAAAIGKARLILLFGSTLLVGCSAFDSTSAFTDSHAHHSRVGHYYFLPKALLTVAGAPDTSGAFVVSVTHSLVPDREQQFYLRWKPNAFSEDVITNLEVDADGLLTSINYTAEDKTPTIVTDLVTAGINAFNAAGQLGVVRSDKPEAKRAPFKYTFDPLNRADLSRVTEELQRVQGIGLRISPKPVTSESVSTKNVITSTPSALPNNGGVFYHPPTTLDVVVRDLKESGFSRGVVTIPDVTRVASFRLGRAFLTKRETNITLVRGEPTKVYLKQPSVVQAATGLISTVTKTVGEAIPTLIKVSDSREIARLKTQQELAAAQSALVTAQKKLLDDQKALDEATAGSTPRSENRSASDVAATEAALKAQREDITTLQETIRNQKREIKRKLQEAGLSPSDLDKAVRAAELDTND